MISEPNNLSEDLDVVTKTDFTVRLSNLLYKASNQKADLSKWT